MKGEEWLDVWQPALFHRHAIKCFKSQYIKQYKQVITLNACTING